MSANIIAEPITIENYSPIYGIFGKEFFMRDRALKHIREPFLDSGVGDLNHERFDAKEDTLESIINAANSLPMFAKARLIEVRNAEALNAKEITPLLDYMASPNETTCLVLVGESVDKKKKLFKILAKMGQLYQFDPGNKRSCAATVKRECAERGYSCDPSVPALISEFLGDQDLGIALDKLFLFVEPGQTITPAHVLATVGSEGEAATFGFIDLFFEQQLEQALMQIKLLFDNNESAIALVSLLARQLRFILYTKAAKGAPDPSSPPFLHRKISSLASKYSYNQLYECHRLLYGADRQLKSSRVEHKLLMENLLFSWCFNK